MEAPDPRDTIGIVCNEPLDVFSEKNWKGASGVYLDIDFAEPTWE